MKIAFTLLLSCLFYAALHADIGGAVVYKAKFVLKNGSSVVGYLPTAGYDVHLDSTGKNEHCSDKAFQIMLNQRFVNEPLKVYNHIYVVHCGHNNSEFFVGCVDQSKIKTLTPKDIKYTVFLNAAYAQYDWFTMGIYELEPSIIEVIRLKPPVNYEELMLDVAESDIVGDHACFINFNPEISSSDLYHIVAELSKKIQLDQHGNKIIPPSEIVKLKAKNIFTFPFYIGPC